MKLTAEHVKTAILGLKSQGYLQSRSEDGLVCAYRGSDSRRCAVGWCIPDEEYDPALERKPPEKLDMCKDDPLWKKLQSCHDHPADSPKRMKKALTEFCTKYFPELVELI